MEKWSRVKFAFLFHLHVDCNEKTEEKKISKEKLATKKLLNEIGFYLNARLSLS